MESKHLLELAVVKRAVDVSAKHLTNLESQHCANCTPDLSIIN